MPLVFSDNGFPMMLVWLTDLESIAYSVTPGAAFLPDLAAQRQDAKDITDFLLRGGGLAVLVTHVDGTGLSGPAWREPLDLAPEPYRARMRAVIAALTPDRNGLWTHGPIILFT